MIYGSSQTNPNYANYRGPATPQSSRTNPYAANYQQRQTINISPKPTGSVLGLKTGGSGVTGGGSNPGFVAQQSNVEQGRDEDLELIDREFEDALNFYADQEGSLKSEAGTSEAKVRSEGTSQEQGLTRRKGESEEMIAGQETQARKAENLGMRDVRDLFRQIQQQNIAQLSGLGISSSSVAEAMAEKLGTETMRRIAGITGSTQEIVNNLNKERIRVQQVFTEKMASLKEDVSNQIAEIQNNLIQGINEINNSRAVAATQKAQARKGIMQEARANILQIQQQAQAYQEKLIQAAQARASKYADALNLATATPQDMASLEKANANARQIYGLGFDITPQFGMSGGQPLLVGQTAIRGGTKRPDEEDLLQPPF